MAKKKKSVAPLLTLVAALMGLVGFIMLFLPAVASKNTDATFTGLEVVFGCKETILKKEVTYLNFSFMNLLTYLLVIAGLVASVLNVAGKKPNKLLSFVATACFAVAAALFFCTVNFLSFNEDASGLVAFLGGDIKETCELAAGAIVGGIASIFGALASAGAAVLK